MTTNIKIFLLCPVPEDQKPINEYINIKDNELFNWVTLSPKKYNEKIRNFFLTFFLVNFFSIQLFNSNSNDFLYQSFLNVLFTIFSFCSFLFIVRFRWLEVKKKFDATRLFYEEASWYDGQIWEKPFELIKNDKLLSTQKIEPIILRITNLLFFFFSLFLIFLFTFQILYVF